MQEIRGEAKTIRQLLSGQRYAIDYLLAKSLHPDCYSHNPEFAHVTRSGVPFAPHPTFRRTDLDQPQHFHVEVADEVRSPDRLGSDSSSGLLRIVAA